MSSVERRLPRPQDKLNTISQETVVGHRVDNGFVLLELACGTPDSWHFSNVESGSRWRADKFCDYLRAAVKGPQNRVSATLRVREETGE